MNIKSKFRVERVKDEMFEGRKHYYVSLFKPDGSSKYIKTTVDTELTKGEEDKLIMVMKQNLIEKIKKDMGWDEVVAQAQEELL